MVDHNPCTIHCFPSDHTVPTFGCWTCKSVWHEPCLKQRGFVAQKRSSHHLINCPRCKEVPDMLSHMLYTSRAASSIPYAPSQAPSHPQHVYSTASGTGSGVRCISGSSVSSDSVSIKSLPNSNLNNSPSGPPLQASSVANSMPLWVGANAFPSASGSTAASPTLKNGVVEWHRFPQGGPRAPTSASSPLSNSQMMFSAMNPAMKLSPPAVDVKMPRLDAVHSLAPRHPDSEKLSLPNPRLPTQIPPPVPQLPPSSEASTGSSLVNNVPIYEVTVSGACLTLMPQPPSPSPPPAPTLSVTLPRHPRLLAVLRSELFRVILQGGYCVYLLSRDQVRYAQLTGTSPITGQAYYHFCDVAACSHVVLLLPNFTPAAAGSSASLHHLPIGNAKAMVSVSLTGLDAQEYAHIASKLRIPHIFNHHQQQQQQHRMAPEPPRPSISPHQQQPTRDLQPQEFGPPPAKAPRGVEMPSNVARGPSPSSFSPGPVPFPHEAAAAFAPFQPAAQHARAVPPAPPLTITSNSNGFPKTHPVNGPRASPQSQVVASGRCDSLSPSSSSLAFLGEEQQQASARANTDTSVVSSVSSRRVSVRHVRLQVDLLSSALAGKLTACAMFTQHSLCVPALDRMLQHLEMRDRLACRAVCQIWKRVVDTSLAWREVVVNTSRITPGSQLNVQRTSTFLAQCQRLTLRWECNLEVGGLPLEQLGNVLSCTGGSLTRLQLHLTWTCRAVNRSATDSAAPVIWLPFEVIPRTLPQLTHLHIYGFDKGEEPPASLLPLRVGAHSESESSSIDIEANNEDFSKSADNKTDALPSSKPCITHLVLENVHQFPGLLRISQREQLPLLRCLVLRSFHLVKDVLTFGFTEIEKLVLDCGNCGLAASNFDWIQHLKSLRTVCICGVVYNVHLLHLVKVLATLDSLVELTLSEILPKKQLHTNELLANELPKQLSQFSWECSLVADSSESIGSTTNGHGESSSSSGVNNNSNSNNNTNSTSTSADDSTGFLSAQLCGDDRFLRYIIMKRMARDDVDLSITVTDLTAVSANGTNVL